MIFLESWYLCGFVPSLFQLRHYRMVELVASYVDCGTLTTPSMMLFCHFTKTQNEKTSA